MTRINIVEPVELADQHLVAEYREIFMVGSSLQRSLKSPKWDPATIPAKYTLNKGHVKFFYDKGYYLHKRYTALVAEMKVRGMNPDPERKFLVDQWPGSLYNDWTPTEEDRNVARERIEGRIAEKPQWYRYYGHPFLRGRYERMGYSAFKRGVKDIKDDPQYTFAVLQENEDYFMNPNDDWTQGWLKAAYEDKDE